MIKAIVTRDIPELIKQLQARGLTLEDVGHSVSTNESGHYVAFYEVEENSFLDTTKGKMGVSGDELTADGSAFVIDSVRTAYTNEAINSGDPVDNIASHYLVPFSITVNFDGGAPSIIDNGFGQMVTAPQGTVVGNVDYETGEIDWAFSFGVVTGNATVDYEVSKHPNTVEVPNSCYITKIAIFSADDSGIGVPGDTALYSSSDKQLPDVIIPSADWDVVPNASLGVSGGNAYVWETHAMHPSLLSDFDPANVGKRWLQTSGTLKAGSYAMVYWDVRQ